MSLENTKFWKGAIHLYHHAKQQIHQLLDLLERIEKVPYGSSIFLNMPMSEFSLLVR